MKGLDPVREHYLAAERARADQTVGAARETARGLIADAMADATAAAQEAQHDGEASADLDTNREWTAARRQARDVVLSAQRAVYDELRAMCEAAIRSDPRYRSLQRGVADEARRRLGPGAGVDVQPESVVVIRKQRRIRWTLTEAVDDALRGLALEVRELWQ